MLLVHARFILPNEIAQIGPWARRPEGPFISSSKRCQAGNEPATGPWFAVRHSPTQFAIFEAFPNMAGRDAHVAGAHQPRRSGRDRGQRMDQARKPD
jgi:hypothetical protein